MGTDRSSKCLVLRVARVAREARTIPAIIVSRSSPGRPFFCRTAIRSAACRAARVSNEATRRSIFSGRTRSNSSMSAERLFPAGITCKPNWTSRIVMEVVQTEVRGCPSSHVITLGSGTRRISAESTFVSTTIISRGGRSDDVTAQLWDVSIEANPGEQRGNLRP